MFIGKWNKSVIMTYVGLLFSVIGFYFSFAGKMSVAFSCLVVAGICDMFDGAIARKCKRDESEKQFGIELDSLVDTFSFVAFPIFLLLCIGLKDWYYIPVFTLYGICGVARLAYFNITVDSKNKNTPVKYYSGLPVTTAAMIFPLLYLISRFIPENILNIYYAIGMLVVSILFISNFKLKKPSTKVYPVFVILAIIVLILFLGVL